MPARSYKLPFHTIIPAFATKDGEPWLSDGVMGGAMQPQGHVYVFLNMVEFGMDPQEAIDAARFRHFSGQSVAIENIQSGVQSALEAKGHQLRDRVGVAFGEGRAIVRPPRGWAVGSDPRKEGMAAGN